MPAPRLARLAETIWLAWRLAEQLVEAIFVTVMVAPPTFFGLPPPAVAHVKPLSAMVSTGTLSSTQPTTAN
jgi:hypothetical protein